MIARRSRLQRIALNDRLMRDDMQDRGSIRRSLSRHIAAGQQLVLFDAPSELEGDAVKNLRRTNKSGVNPSLISGKFSTKIEVL